MTSLLKVSNLRVDLPTPGGMRRIVHDVSLEIGEGQSLGLVGESGSGKSVTTRAIMRLLPPKAEVAGAVTFGGRSVLNLASRELSEFRATEIACIFQDPRAYINPVRKVGDFLVEGLKYSRRMAKDEAVSKVSQLLRDMGINDPEHRLGQYPHELSGGLLQRMMIAAALATEPRLIIADEPTTALDVTTQSEVMAILDELRTAHHVALLLITHDLDLAAAVCDRTAVMYAGRIVDDQPSTDLHDKPLHPYSAALSASRPSIDRTSERLFAIGGRSLAAFEAPNGCSFGPRCEYVQPRCVEEVPELREVGSDLVACHRSEELRDELHEVAVQ